MKKIAKLNDGRSIEYKSIDDLIKQCGKPYDSFSIIENSDGLLIDSINGICFGEYESMKDEEDDITNMD